MTSFNEYKVCYTYLFVRLAESLNIVTVLERRPCDYLMTQNRDSKNIVTLVHTRRTLTYSTNLILSPIFLMAFQIRI